MKRQEELFQARKQLQKEIEELTRELHVVQEKQESLKSIEKIAKLVIEYIDIENRISDRGVVFTFLSSPEDVIASPYRKSELFSVIEAAETVNVDLVDLVVEVVLEKVREDIQNGEDDSVDLIHAEFKEYVLPGKIIAERFDEIDALVDEMNRYCKSVDARYSVDQARAVLKYAFGISIDADTRMEPTIEAIKTMPTEYLTSEDRAELLDRVEERFAIMRYDEAKNQQLAMDTAVRLLEQREDQSGK